MNEAHLRATKSLFAFWLFIFSTIVFLWLFYIFLKPFLVASLLVLATSVFADKLEAKLDSFRFLMVRKNKELISASILTFLFGVLIFAPTLYIIIYIVGDFSAISSIDFFEIKTKLEALVVQNGFLSAYAKSKIVENLNLFFTEEFWAKEARTIFSSVGGFLRGVASSFAELVVIAVFFFLLHWFKKDVSIFIKSLIPMDEYEKEMMISEMLSAISVVFLALLGIMAAQGAAFFALMLFFDYDAALLGVFAAISSVVPIFGTGLVWIPIAIFELMSGNIFGAVVIALYSWFVMAFLIDNFLRLFLLNKLTSILSFDYKMNEFLLFFSIAAGIAAFGFWGFILGPSITAFFLSSSRVYKNMYKKES